MPPASHPQGPDWSRGTYLDLDILGLRVQLNRVVLDITAVPGPGNLLGNLLCAVAGLLDGGPLAGLLGQLRTLLNQVLAALDLGLIHPR